MLYCTRCARTLYSYSYCTEHTCTCSAVHYEYVVYTGAEHAVELDELDEARGPVVAQVERRDAHGEASASAARGAHAGHTGVARERGLERERRLHEQQVRQRRRPPRAPARAPRTPVYGEGGRGGRRGGGGGGLRAGREQRERQRCATTERVPTRGHDAAVPAHTRPITVQYSTVLVSLRALYSTVDESDPIAGVEWSWRVATKNQRITVTSPPLANWLIRIVL